MARYFSDSTDAQDEAKNKKKADNCRSFRELLAIVYGCDPHDCSYRLSLFGGKSDKWLEHFAKAESFSDPSGPESAIITAYPIANIKIKHKQVAGEINADKGPRDNLLTALAMATCAKANKTMREKGAKMDGQTPQEMVYLLVAAEYVGLKVINTDPGLKKEATRLKKQINSDEIWREFVKMMESEEPQAENDKEPQQAVQAPNTTEPPEAPKPPKPPEESGQTAPETPPAPPPAPEKQESLTAIFNREIAPDAKPFLVAHKVDEKTYKAISEAIIRDQDARADTVKERYKDKFNLTGNQLQNILKAMDAEGLTSSRPGKARAVNFDSAGMPKDNAAPAAP